MITLLVKAVVGRMLPDLQRKNAFVGYTEAAAGEPADHEVPGGRRYKFAGVVRVPDSPYHRRAIKRGDLEQVVDAKPETGATRQKRED